MLRLLVIKIILLLLAIIGIHTNALWICAPGKSPAVPSNCEKL